MKDTKSVVAVIPCEKYDEEQVYESLKRGIDALGGIERFVNKDEKILVKPNLLSAAAADKAVTTHPAVLRGVLRILNEYGCKNVKFGDSPGHGSCEGAVKALGLDESNTFGAMITPMSEEVHTDFPEGIACNEFYFCREVVESDAIINVCKMKTHALERVTGAVKNVYGFVCGYRKAAGHVKFPNDTVFARMLSDIHRYTHPRLHIMDGIMAMEGNGPAAGNPVAMNVLLISEDPVALDTVFCYLVDVDPEIVPTNSQGSSMGIGTDSEDEIDILLCSESGAVNISRTELFKSYGNPSFDVARNKPRRSFLMEYSGLMTRLSRRPVINKSKCVRCGVCVEHCPVPGKAVDFKNGCDNAPVYDYSKCIRCYCCQEMCPMHAIEPGRGLFGNKKGSAGINTLLVIILLLILLIGGIFVVGTRMDKKDAMVRKSESLKGGENDIATVATADKENTAGTNEPVSTTNSMKDQETTKTENKAESITENVSENATESKETDNGISGLDPDELNVRTVPEGYSQARSLKAKEMVSQLSCGWNLGNALESIGSETAWGNPKTGREMIDAVAEKGFNTIRIPVSWGQYVSKTDEGYIIKKEWLERVGDVVDYAIENDMYVILNTHHETDWIIPKDENITQVKAEFCDIWLQIAVYFKDYGDHLIFEGLNEPRVVGGPKEWEGGTYENRKNINELEKAFVDTVRSVGKNNETRLLLVTSEAACVTDEALKEVRVPDDDYVAMSLHAYTPYDFTFSHDGDYDKWDGSHQSDIVWMFGQLDKYFLKEGIPVILTEFGAERKGSADNNNDTEVAKWMADYVALAEEYKVPVIIWDNNLFNGQGERFGYFNRKTLEWDREEVIDTMINGYNP